MKRWTTATIALGSMVLLTACQPAPLYNFTAGLNPGEGCNSPASLRVIQVGHTNRQKQQAAKSPPASLPDLVRVSNIQDISVEPPARGSDRRYCKATATFADGSADTVFYGWRRDWDPKTGSASEFDLCFGPARAGCGRAIPPGYTG